MNVLASPYSFGNITLIPVHFSETAQQVFLIFCMKLGDYKGRKVTEPDFLKNGFSDVFGFWREVSTKYDLQFK